MFGVLRASGVLPVYWQLSTGIVKMDSIYPFVVLRLSRLHNFCF